jgi:hypothetical protein
MERPASPYPPVTAAGSNPRPRSLTDTSIPSALSVARMAASRHAGVLIGSLLRLG